MKIFETKLKSSITFILYSLIWRGSIHQGYYRFSRLFGGCDFSSKSEEDILNSTVILSPWVLLSWVTMHNLSTIQKMEGIHTPRIFFLKKWRRYIKVNSHTFTMGTFIMGENAQLVNYSKDNLTKDHICCSPPSVASIEGLLFRSLWEDDVNLPIFYTNSLAGSLLLL